MSRRSQQGSIEQSGKWYVVRFWKDVLGQDKRIHASERICPIEGPECLKITERKRKALEIMATSGVYSSRQFAATTIGVTFQEQARLFIRQKTTSKRKPVKPATLCTWESCLQTWLNPNIGEMQLANINNAVMKQLVEKMSIAGLSPKTIVNYTRLVKLAVQSAKSEDGEPLFPRTWDSEVIDLPIVKNQRQPKFLADTMSSIVDGTTGQYRVLYALLASTGLRVGEAFGLVIGKHISTDCRVIHVRQSVWQRQRKTRRQQPQYEAWICAPLYLRWFRS